MVSFNLDVCYLLCVMNLIDCMISTVHIYLEIIILYMILIDSNVIQI